MDARAPSRGRCLRAPPAFAYAGAKDFGEILNDGRQTVDWLDEVTGGNFAAIPPEASFDEASRLALLFDGHAVCGGVPGVQRIANRVVGDIRESGQTNASALDCCVWRDRGKCESRWG